MLVDSSGSRKPLDRPTATTFRCHCLRVRPVRKRMILGSPIALESRLLSRMSAASSSLQWLLL